MTELDGAMIVVATVGGMVLTGEAVVEIDVTNVGADVWIEDGGTMTGIDMGAAREESFKLTIEVS